MYLNEEALTFIEWYESRLEKWEKTPSKACQEEQDTRRGIYDALIQFSKNPLTNKERTLFLEMHDNKSDYSLGFREVIENPTKYFNNIRNRYKKVNYIDTLNQVETRKY